MGERVRRIRLLVVVGLAGLLALAAAWPSPSAAAETPPLYLARERGAAAGSGSYRSVGDGPRLVTHVLADKEDINRLEVIDSAGRVVILRADGTADATGTVVSPAACSPGSRRTPASSGSL